MKKFLSIIGIALMGAFCAPESKAASDPMATDLVIESNSLAHYGPGKKKKKKRIKGATRHKAGSAPKSKARGKGFTSCRKTARIMKRRHH